MVVGTSLGGCCSCSSNSSALSSASSSSCSFSTSQYPRLGSLTSRVSSSACVSSSLESKLLLGVESLVSTTEGIMLKNSCFSLDDKFTSYLDLGKVKSVHFSLDGSHSYSAELRLGLKSEAAFHNHDCLSLSLLFSLSSLDLDSYLFQGFKKQHLCFTPGAVKYWMECVPLLLKSETIDNVQKVLSSILTPLPTSAEEFIKWIAEVRRQEEGVQNFSIEEKGQLDIKGEVLQQVHETELFKRVTDWLSSASICCRDVLSSSNKDNLQEIAARICCQGAEFLTWSEQLSEGFAAGRGVQCVKANGIPPQTLVSGEVVTGGSEEGFDMLVPVSQMKPGCCNGLAGMHPASNDVLAALLLACLHIHGRILKMRSCWQTFKIWYQLKNCLLCFKRSKEVVYQQDV